MKPLFVFAFLISGCGAMTGQKIDKRLQGAVDRYLAHVPNQGKWDDLESVQFGSPSKEAFGECVTVRGKYDSVVKRKVVIKDLDEPEIMAEVTVAHELAHCLHGKIHVGGGDVHLMNPVRQGDAEWWTNNLNDQIEGLFK